MPVCRAAFDSPCSRCGSGTDAGFFRSAEIYRKGIAGNLKPIVHTALAFDPTAQRSCPQQDCLSLGQHVREDDDAPPCLEPRKNPNIALAGLLAVALASTAYAQKKYDPGATDTEIKIGNIMPYSGPASAYATIGKTEAAYFNKINSEGGINGRKINFISYDDGYSPPKTVEQARKLVESDEVLLIFNPLGTPGNTAIQKYMNAKKVPQIFVSSGAAKWNDPKNFRGPWAGSPTTRPRPASTPTTS